MILDHQTELHLLQCWGIGFAVGLSIILAFWIVHAFKAASDFGGE